jgi:hypothetical protein
MYIHYRVDDPEPGRPRISVDIEDIEFLSQLRFSYTEIARILQISRSTLYRRLENEGISRFSKYSDITDSDLDRELIEIKLDHPNDGERLLIGHLAARGIIVPRVRIRASIHRVDPENTRLRRSVTIRRRTYHVEGPNAVWHVDGNHKLIRWRMVIHGSIDGYSRSVTFLKCSNNNRASTVLSAFTSAVELHGLPERIRTDLGGENVGIWQYMVEQHNTTRAVITGSSTHNERIERLWRDVYRCVGVLYHDCFRELEDRNSLNPLNETDIYCLHYIYIPRINLTLEKFAESWNNHSLSSENNFTPNQLFIQGAIQQNMTPYYPPNISIRVAGDGQLPSPSDHVTVPQNGFVPCPSLYRDISRIDPLDSSDDFGRHLYLRVQNVVGLHLVIGCNECTVV